MKYIHLSILCLLASVFTVLAGAYSSSVTSTSAAVLPSRTLFPGGIQAWTSGIIVADGEYIRTATHGLYMALSAGTSTQSPDAAYGDDANDALTWRKVASGGRKGLSIQVLSNTVYIATGNDAVVGTGAIINSTTPFFIYGGYTIQERIEAISASQTTLHILDW